MKKTQKVKITKRINLIILWRYVRTLIQIIYQRTRNDHLGLKPPYKTQKESRFQKEHPGKLKDRKDSQVMQHT
jgi:hypothetical protein